MDLSNYSANAVLRNGMPLFLRAIRPGDKQQLSDGFHRLTGKSVYLRFLGPKHDLTERDLKYFTELDFNHHVAIAAIVQTDRGERPIGVGRYIEIESDQNTRLAEVAFAIEDAYQNLGAGTILFEHLVGIARSQGFSRIQAEIFTSNKPMLDIFEHSGFALRKRLTEGILHIEFDLGSED